MNEADQKQYEPKALGPLLQRVCRLLQHQVFGHHGANGRSGQTDKWQGLALCNASREEVVL